MLEPMSLIRPGPVTDLFLARAKVNAFYDTRPERMFPGRGRLGNRHLLPSPNGRPGMATAT